MFRSLVCIQIPGVLPYEFSVMAFIVIWLYRLVCVYVKSMLSIQVEQGREATLNFFKWLITSYLVASICGMIVCIFSIAVNGITAEPFSYLVYSIISVCAFNFTSQMFTSYVSLFHKHKRCL